MHVRGRSGRGRVFPYDSAVGARRLGQEIALVVCAATAAATTTAATTATAAAASVTVVVMVVVVVVVGVVVVVVTGAVRPRQPVGHVPALDRGRAVARGLALVHGRVAAGTAVDRVPAAQPHAAREEQLEEQPLELLTEYHVDDEVHGRVDGDQQVADLDHLVHRDAVERLGHVRY